MYHAVESGLRAFLIVLCVLGATISARAQTVHTEELSGINARTGNGAAEEQNRSDWADIRGGETGTHVVLSADLRNADATLYTNLSFGADALLTEGKKIAQAMDAPRIDFIVLRGRRTTVGVDLEFNDYINGRGRGASRVSLDLGKLARALEASRLPRPVSIFVEADKNDITVATLRVPGEPPRRIQETFFAPNDITTEAVLVYDTQVPAWGYAVAAFFGVMALAPAWLQVSLHRHEKRMRAKRRETAVMPEPVPDPQTVQAQYDKQKPLWMLIAVPMLLPLGMGVLMLTGGVTRGLAAGLAVFQSLGVSFVVLPPAMLGVWAVAWAIRFFVERADIRREGGAVAPDPQTAPDTAPTWTMFAPLYPMIGAMGAMMALLLFPPLRTTLYAVSPNGVSWYLGTVGVLTVAGIVYLSLRARRVTHYDLPPDHPIRAVIAELTKDAGVRVRRVEVVRSVQLNASVDVFRRVAFTSRLLREFSPDELRVVIAHEIGHFRAADPPRQVLTGLVLTAALLGAWYAGGRWLEAHYALSREAKALLYSPLFSFFVVPVVRFLLTAGVSRRAELAADRFAVDAMNGNGAFVIATLTKLHTLNGTPHMLKPGDEAISTHPSLASRVAAIRAYVAEKSDT